MKVEGGKILVGCVKVVVSTMLSVLCVPAFSSNLIGPVDVESTAVLPKGIRSPQLKGVYFWPEEKFGVQGKVSPLGANLNKMITWNDILSGLSSTDRRLLEGRLGATNLETSPGSTVGEVKTFYNIQVPVLAWGVSESLTLAVALPIYRTEVSAGAGFSRTDEGQALINEWCDPARGNPETCNKMVSNMNGAIANKLREKGYDPIQSERSTSLGDVKLVQKWKVAKLDDQAFAIKFSQTLPTGRAPNANKVIDVSSGDGQWDLGVAGVWDYSLPHRLSVSTSLGYTSQLPDTLERRIPENEESSISADREMVYRDSGDQMSFGSSLQYGSSTGGFLGSLAYNYQYMNGTSFRGTQFSQERYRYLESLHPLQDLHSASLFLGYSTIDAYREKRFLLPMQARIGVSHPVAGRNVITADVFTADFVMFF